MTSNPRVARWRLSLRRRVVAQLVQGAALDPVTNDLVERDLLENHGARALPLLRGEVTLDAAPEVRGRPDLSARRSGSGELLPACGVGERDWLLSRLRSSGMVAQRSHLAAAAA